MSIYKKPNRPYYHFDFQHEGHRFHGSTECTTRKEAETVEAVEREKAKALVKAMKRRARRSLIDDVAARFGIRAGSTTPSRCHTKNLARLIEYFGKRSRSPTSTKRSRSMVAWRRGHRVKLGRQGRNDAADLQRHRQPRDHQGTAAAVHLCQVGGRVFENEPKWDELLLQEPVERVRELQDDEAARSMRRCGRTMSRSSTSCARAACGRPNASRCDGGRSTSAPADRSHRQGRQARGLPDHRHHPRNPVPAAGPAPRVRVHLRRGLRQQAAGPGARPALPAHHNGAKTAWQRMRATAGVTDFRFHDYRHDFGTKLLREPAT